MKKQMLILLSGFAMVLPAMASPVVIVCTANKDIMQAQFNGTLTLDVGADGSTWSGQAVYTTSNLIDQSKEDSGTVQVSGSKSVIPAGELTLAAVDHYEVLTSSDPINYFSINVGMPDGFSSHLLVDRERGYVSNCVYQTPAAAPAPGAAQTAN